MSRGSLPSWTALAFTVLLMGGCVEDAGDPTAPSLVPAPSFSAVPGGGLDRIAFGSNRGGSWDIWVIQEDGSALTQLTSGPATEDEPSFSPDGSRVAFASDADGDFDVYVMDDDGSNVVQLTDAPGDDRFPSFSPDGSEIAFQSERDGTPGIFVMDSGDGSGVTRLVPAEAGVFADRQPAYSADGTRVAFARTTDFHNAIFVLDRASGAVERVSVDDLQANGSPSFSPDGSRIALQGFLGSEPYEANVWSVNATAPPPGDILNGRMKLTDTPGYQDGSPAYDPDQDRIAFASERNTVLGSFDQDVFIMNGDGTGAYQVTPSGGINWNPSFGPPAGPTSRADCRKGGWKDFGFRNQGECMKAVNEAERAAKVAVCHLDDEGVFVLRQVAEPAVPGHLGHGDQLPGDELPDGSTLGEGCEMIPPEPEALTYALQVDLTTTRYFGSDPVIAAALPPTGTASGTLTYDPDAAGAPTVSPPIGTTYAMTPADGHGLSVTFDNGLVWETDPAGDFRAWVIDRPAGTGADVVRFQSDQALLPVAGLTTDFIWVAFGDLGGDLLPDESLPATLDLATWPKATIDFRALDSNNSEFRVFGKVTSLTPVP